MPAGYGNRCESCYWNATALKRIDINLETLGSKQFRTLYRSFGLWLIEQKGAKKAALELKTQLNFFSLLEAQWGNVPSYKELMEYRGDESLHKAKAPIKWLEHTALITVDNTIKERSLERRRITAIVHQLPQNSPQQPMLRGYLNLMEQRYKDERISVRTLRLSLRPAVSLLLQSEPKPPSQQSLELYLSQSPGQKAAIGSFISFLNSEFDLTLRLSEINKASLRKHKEKSLEKEMSLLANPDLTAKDREQKWLELALCYFHEMTKKRSRSLLMQNGVRQLENGYSVADNGNQLYIPPIPDSIKPVNF